MTATVLVVDDIEANVKLLEAKLLSEYYTVLTASSGLQALEIIKQEKVDIVLLDVMMPEMDGFETCKKIKSDPESTHIPVVMITALSDIEDRVKGLESGADEFLTKPPNDVALYARVKALSRMKKVIDELKLRNKTNAELGGHVTELNDNFSDAKIILLDDDVIQARNIKNYLSKLTNHIEVVTTPDAMDSEEKFTPDLIIISCQLDSQDPLRIVVSTRSQEKFKNAVIMMLAEEENTPMVIKGIELGVNDYFIYPVDESELHARVKTQLRRKQYQNDLRRELEQSVDLSTKDGLTGVFNRRYFDIHLERMIERASDKNMPFCLMILDIDHFKSINDTYGHQSGDAVLKKLTSYLKEAFRVTDLIARYGGEEFTIILQDVNLSEGTHIAERTRKAISDLKFIIPVQQEPLQKTCSIGIAEYKSGETSSDLIKRVDEALYQAKEGGRNKVIVAS